MPSFPDPWTRRRCFPFPPHPLYHFNGGFDLVENLALFADRPVNPALADTAGLRTYLRSGYGNETNHFHECLRCVNRNNGFLAARKLRKHVAVCVLADCNGNLDSLFEPIVFLEPSSSFLYSSVGSPSESRKIAGANEPATSRINALRDSFSFSILHISPKSVSPSASR